MGIEDLRTQVQIKLERSIELREEIVRLCLSCVDSKDERIRLKIASQVGDFSNNLRSVLNYSVKRFSESRIKPILPSNRDFRRLNGDFPWANTKDNFDSKRFVQTIKSHFPPVYKFLEEAR
jgi:hypothetical protein